MTMATGKEPRGQQVPARTSSGQEAKMISLATDLAQKQLLEGTASAQVITHFLKLGTEKEKLENELLKAKVEALESAQRMEALVGDALEAFKTYRGSSDD